MSTLTPTLLKFFVEVGKIVITYDICRFVFRNIKNMITTGDTDLE